MVSQVGHSQNITPSPNASALGTYADVPVNTYTGIPNITLPIQTITSRDISVPVVLSYHASGIKVAQEASWVGLGWALQAGGVITRTVRGKDDLKLFGYPDANELPASDENNNIVPDEDARSYVQNVCDGLTDAEPDLFYFNLPTLSGKFFLGKRGSANDPLPVNLISQSKVKITYDESNQQWTIITPEGYRYTFSIKESTATLIGSGTSEAEADATLFERDNPVTTAWYLDKITSPKGGEITFEYDDVYHATQGSIYRSHTERTVLRVQRWAPNSAPLGDNCQNGDYYSSTRNYVDDVYLKRIVFANGTLEFETTDRTDMIAREGAQQNPQSPQKLQQIVLKDLSGNVKQKMVFTYDYFNAEESSLFKRLKLVNVVKYNEGTAEAPYQFSYNETNSLPAKDSKATDYWGYYNGHLSNNELLPAFTLEEFLRPEPIDNLNLENFKTDGWDNTCAFSCTDYASCNDCWDIPFTPQSFSGAIKTPDSSFVQTGVLNQIKYPTGGTTSFEYELHDFSVGIVVEEPLSIGGGIRIARVEESDSLHSVIVRQYEYTKEENNNIVSSGRLLSPVIYFYPTSSNRGNTSSGGFYRCYWLVRSSSPTLPLGASAQGNLVGYDKVTILYGETGQNGKTEYTYRNREETPGTSLFPALPNRYYQDNGFLITQIDYALSGGDYQPVRSLENRYPEQAVIQEEYKAMKTFSDDCSSGVISVKFYDLTSEWWYADSTIVRSYNLEDESLFQETITEFDYNNPDHKQLSEVTVIDSEGNSHTTTYEYAEDFATATDPTQFGSNLLRDDNIHMHGQVLRQITEVDGIETQRVTTTYDSISGHVLPAQTTTYPSGFTAGNSIATEYAYDQHGNLIYQQGEGERSTAFLWGYNHEYPVAEVANALQDEFRYTGFEEEDQNVSNDARTGQQSYNAQYTARLPGTGTYWLTYWQKSGGEWNYVSQTISADTLIGGAGTLIDDVRVYPLDALMTTYTYDPLYGRTSMTGSDGTIHYQEYDDLGRLKLTRDHRGRIEQSYFYHYQQ